MEPVTVIYAVCMVDPGFLCLLEGGRDVQTESRRPVCVPRCRSQMAGVLLLYHKKRGLSITTAKERDLKMKFLYDKNGKITRRIVTDRTYIENMTLFVDGKPYAMIDGSFDMREAILTGKLFQ